MKNCCAVLQFIFGTAPGAARLVSVLLGSAPLSQGLSALLTPLILFQCYTWLMLYDVALRCAVLCAARLCAVYYSNVMCYTVLCCAVCVVLCYCVRRYCTVL